MMARTIWVVVLAAAVSAGAIAQQQPPAVPSAAPTVQAGDTRPIHVYIRAGLKSHGEGAHDYPQFSRRLEQAPHRQAARSSTARFTFRRRRSSPTPT